MKALKRMSPGEKIIRQSSLHVFLVLAGCALGLASVLVVQMGLNIQYIATLVYVVALLALFLISRNWRLGALFLFALGAPPFVDYELAWVAPTAFRRTQGIRAMITQPIFCALDLLLLLGALVFMRQRLERKSVGRLPLWFVFCLGGLVFLSVLSSSLAIHDNPNYSLTAMAGFANSLRIVLAVLYVLSATKGEIRSRELTLALSLGTLLFTLESLYVTVVKNGGFQLGSVQTTGLIPGPGGSGSLLALVVPILLGILMFERNKKMKILLLSSAMIGLGYALMTYSRATYLGLFVSTIVLIWGAVRAGKRGVWRIVGIVSVTTFFVLSRASQYFLMKFGAMIGGDVGGYYNLARRLEYWQLALSLVKENWQLGVGPLMWGIVAGGYGNHAHQAFLQFAAENGVAAVCLLGILILTALWTGIRRQRLNIVNPVNQGLQLGLLSGLCGYLVTQIFENSFGHFRMTVLFWSVICLLVVTGGKETSSSENAL